MGGLLSAFFRVATHSDTLQTQHCLSLPSGVCPEPLLCPGPPELRVCVLSQTHRRAQAIARRRRGKNGEGRAGARPKQNGKNKRVRCYDGKS